MFDAQPEDLREVVVFIMERIGDGKMSMKLVL